MHFSLKKFLNRIMLLIIDGIVDTCMKHICALFILETQP